MGDVQLARFTPIFGKRTDIHEFSNQHRGGKGVIAIQTSDRNGKAVTALQVKDDDEIMLISSNGTLVRTSVSDISIIGRNTQGVKLIRLDEGAKISSLSRVVHIDTENTNDEEAEKEEPVSEENSEA